MMRVLYVLRLSKRHILGQKRHRTGKKNPIALPIVELCLAGGISYVVTV